MRNEKCSKKPFISSFYFIIYYLILICINYKCILRPSSFAPRSHICEPMQRNLLSCRSKQHIVLLGYDETIQTIKNCQFALWQFDNIAMAVLHHHIAVYDHIVVLALLHRLIDTVPGTKVSPTEVTLHHRDIV